MAELRKLVRMKDRLIVSLPLAISRALGWTPGDYVTFELIAGRTVTMRRVDVPRAGTDAHRETRARG